MAQIISFPGGGPAAPSQKAPAARARPMPPASAPSVVRPLRKGGRIPKKPRPEDLETADFARMANAFADKAYALAQIEPGGTEHRLMLHMAGIDRKIPRNNLRCIVSTLDAERDFDLRCAEVALLRAEHEVEERRRDQQRILGDPGDLEEESRDRAEFWKRWNAYRARVLELAGTPAHTWPQLERKRRIIGTCWLKASGDWYDQLRVGVAADEAWLAENRPKRRRGGKQ